MTKKKTQEISLNNYPKLLAEVKKSINEAGRNIARIAIREKVVMAWEIGQLIHENLQGNKRAGYGEKLITQLALDSKLSKKVLYKMHNFYQSYPQLPEDNEKLNWSHYRTLSGIKKTEERKYLEYLAIENSWSSIRLEKEVKNSKLNPPKNQEDFEENYELEAKKAGQLAKSKAKKLYPVRGQLFTYHLVKLDDSGQKFVDLGFDIFQEIETEITVGETIVSEKRLSSRTDEYSFTKTEIHGRKLNIYKAYLDRVVDGDTIKVILDLGFKTFHREILRLKGINAPESNTLEGKKSTEVLKGILKDQPFLVIKTIKIDIYGRYVCDIFLDKKGNSEADPQAVADFGIYLNQLLLDKGVVAILKGNY